MANNRKLYVIRLILRGCAYCAAVAVGGGLLFACAPDAPEPLVPPPDEEQEEEPQYFPMDPEPTIPPDPEPTPYQEHEGLEIDVPDAPDPIWSEEETE